VEADYKTFINKSNPISVGCMKNKIKLVEYIVLETITFHS